MATLLLASSSPRRLALLAQLGLTPDATASPDIDESPHPHEQPRAHALRLAEAKALAVPHSTGIVVLAGDTVVACGRRILPKAEDAETVAACLRLLSGRRHDVWSAIAVRDGTGKIRTRISRSRLRFKKLHEDEIAHYVQSGEGLGKAGGYALQGMAAAFILDMQGSPSGVIGLPLYETRALLKSAGFAIG